MSLKLLPSSNMISYSPHRQFHVVHSRTLCLLTSNDPGREGLFHLFFRIVQGYQACTGISGRNKEDVISTV